MTFTDSLKSFLRKVLIIAPSVITVASAITAITPNPNDDAVMLAIHKLLDVIALNVGQNAQHMPTPEEIDSGTAF